MVKYKPFTGARINEVAEIIVKLAKDLQDQVCADFNEINLTANPKSQVNDIIIYYQEKRIRRINTHHSFP